MEDEFEIKQEFFEREEIGGVIRGGFFDSKSIGVVRKRRPIF